MADQPYDNPFAWFDAWFSEASQTGSTDPNAMTLSTISSDVRPSSRIVLLKQWDTNGFVFYTNRTSRKGQELASNPVAALNFFWRDLGRQIRIEGDVEEVSEAESNEYFASRPRGSKIGAWASNQSRPVESRGELIRRTDEVEARFEGAEVERPPHWGGFRVKPTLIEFWQAGEFRLHDRWEWTRVEGVWMCQRLFP